jgi:hypothetical protein
MLVKMRNSAVFSAAFAAMLLIAVSLSTCDSPLGFGKPIDWEAPVLNLDPGTNPRYVRLGTKLTGSVTDNVSVDRVILRDATTGEQLFTASLFGNSYTKKDWEIELEFTEERNGEKLAVEIVAYDRAGNSGDVSIAAISLIIDIRDPFTKDIYIERTRTSTGMRIAYLEEIRDLYALEATDGPRGKTSANADRYQNGWFKIKAELEESETSIQNVKLNIYDTGRSSSGINPEDPLLSLDIEEGTSLYSPSWFLKEEDIIAAGQARWGDYSASFYNAGRRYYYLVAVVASDKSENELFDQMGYFCLSYDSDFPRGVLDSVVAGDGDVFVGGGATLPIEFFDDDTLEWAYADMLTKDQWDGAANLNASSLKMLDGAVGDDDAKLEWLMTKLREPATIIYNWKYDKRTTNNTERITEVLQLDPGKSLNKKIHYVQTGNLDSDYGDFVLVTFAGDAKLEPHDTTDITLKKRRGMKWNVQVIDANAPIIVFDTVDPTADDYDANTHPGSTIKEPNVLARTGNSPEENTFPRLRDGRYFEINGYTLRENGGGNKEVTKFRMAWIPNGMNAGVDEIKAVQDALKDREYPDVAFPAGVQHWDLRNGMVVGQPEPVVGIPFKKQVFRKTFDVLGGNAANTNGIPLAGSNGEVTLRNPSGAAVVGNEPHFVYNGELENETKLFIFYAEDNMGNAVFRNLRLLGNKKPPKLAVYNITGYPGIDSIGLSPPNIKDDMAALGRPSIDNDVRTRYRGRLLTQQSLEYPKLAAIALSGGRLNDAIRDYPSEPLQAYPRDAMLKYWVTAEEAGDLEINRIQMLDITNSGDPQDAGFYNGTTRALSYVELLPEVTQRVFTFTATDTLGNVAKIQRTVSVTNAAVLSEIDSTRESGTYGITKPGEEEIILRAVFTNQVRWTGSAPPVLNIRYSDRNNAYVYRQIPSTTTVNSASLFLEFKFKVEEGFRGQIETMWDGFPDNGAPATIPSTNGLPFRDRPIALPSGTLLLDATRGDAAYIPKYGTGLNWLTDNGSLQKKRKIYLDGLRPAISARLRVDGKTAYTANEYYFKAGETISFTLTATDTGTTDRALYTYRKTGQTTNPIPRIQFTIGGTTYYAPYQRSTFNTATYITEMIFSITVPNDSSLSDGQIDMSSIRLNTENGYIGDSVRNYLTSTIDSEANGNLQDNSEIPADYQPSPVPTVYVDKTPPTAPPTTLNPAGTAESNVYYFNQNPVLTITATAPTNEPQGIDRVQYSLNNGFTWSNYPPNPPSNPAATGTVWNNNTLTISNGRWDLKTRYVDKAGNEGATFDRPLWVNAAFPELKSISAEQPSGWYPRDGNTLTFTLVFGDPVRVTTPGDVKITLTNRANSNTNNPNGTNPSYEITLTAAAATALSSTVTLTWNPINNASLLKEMRQGLYVSQVTFTGLTDRFGNTGGTWSGTWPANGNTAPKITVGTSDCTNLLAGLRVDAIVPKVDARVPAASGVATTTVSTTDYRNTITLTFSEPVIKGSGTITIKPEANFLIPPVFENDGYYLDAQNDTRSNTSVQGRTSFVAGFYDIYNSGLTAAQRNALTQGTTTASQTMSSRDGIPSSALDETNPSMSRLRLNTRTGQSAGPYIRTTHGLTAGNGYSGGYGPTYTNGPNTTGTGTFAAMIPDTATKWVLDYQYGITTSDATVTAIRAALVAAKFRWQEIDVVSSSVTLNSTGNTVTITLNEPLLKGLQWEIAYPAGTFTDEAGNSAAAETYTFWSPGAQKPVIRVERKSSDARSQNWHTPVTSGQNNTTSYTYAESTDTGWTLTDFNTVNYRIESETPGANIYYGATTAPANSITTAGAGPFDAVTAAWSGDVPNVGTDYTATEWNNVSSTTTLGNRWVRPNLIRRSGNDTGNNTPNRNTYTVNGLTRASQGNLALIRSYNRDATTTALNNLVAATPASGDVTNGYAGSFTFGALEAGKRYVAAVARKNHGTGNDYYSARGYEGAFRTLIMLYYSTARSDNTRIVVQGSNIKNGMPSIPGFPVQDAAEQGDSRFIKMMYRNQTSGPTQFFWISTEIVSEWYFLKFGGSGNASHMNIGEVNNYLMVSYGDLTYGRNITSSGE